MGKVRATRIQELATQPVVSLAEFAAARAEAQPAQRERPAPPAGSRARLLDLAPALRQARLDAFLGALLTAIENTRLPAPRDLLLQSTTHHLVLR